MELLVTRDIKVAAGTMGRLCVDGNPAGFTLELPVRDGLPGSAIPCGRFKVTLWNSPHFGRMMPLLQDVPGRSSIEIHWGSFEANTRGCILIGEERDESILEIFHTREMFDQLFPAIEASVEGEGCWITVEENPQPSNHDAVQEAVS